MSSFASSEVVTDVTAFFALGSEMLNDRYFAERREGLKPPDEGCSTFGVPKHKKTITKKEETPRRFTAPITFDSCDINIFTLDRRIQEKLKDQIKDLPELHLKLKNLLWVLNNAADPSDKYLADEQLTLLRTKVQDIEGGVTIGLYLLRAEPILEEYRRINALEQNEPVTFGAAKKSNAVVDKRKSELRLDFVRVAKDYIDLKDFDQSQLMNSRLTCECGSQVFDACEESNYICRVCGAIVEQMEETPMFPDTDRVNMCARYAYSRRTHFIDAIACFQAKESTVIPPNVIEIVEEQMRLHHITIDKLTKHHVMTFLSEQGLPRYYMNVPSIYYTITKKMPPNILEYEQRLIEGHDKLEAAYRRVRDPTRVNSMNVYFKLYKLLKREGFACKSGDFPLLKTKQKRDEHEEMYAKCCEELGWENTLDE